MAFKPVASNAEDLSTFSWKPTAVEFPGQVSKNCHSPNAPPLGTVIVVALLLSDSSMIGLICSGMADDQVELKREGDKKKAKMKIDLVIL